MLCKNTYLGTYEYLSNQRRAQNARLVIDIDSYDVYDALSMAIYHFISHFK